MMGKILYLICWLFLHSIIVAQCSGDDLYVSVQIIPDDYPEEIHWYLADEEGTILAENGAQNGFACINPLSCILFTITDLYGDGICCGGGEGSYHLSINGTEIVSGGNFGYSTSHYLNCAPGTVCDASLEITAGQIESSTDDSWYLFSPAETGLYKLDACEISDENCPIALYVYSTCPSVTATGPEGTLFYSSNCVENASSAGASLTYSLIADESYYIRLGASESGACFPLVTWTLSYLGPIVGCTDITSCTYNPFASISDPAQCFYYPSENCPEELPDFELDVPLLTSSFYLDHLENNDDCLVNEGCLTGYGPREIIRFSTRITNIGTADYYIGPPANDNPQFEFDNCHGHYHYEGYTQYLLFNDAGQSLPSGFKNGFCVLDLDCSEYGGTAQYGCDNMGMSAKCADEYWADLECQWVDVTDLPTGDYTLVVRINWDKSPDKLGRTEMSFDNNYGQVCFHLERDEFTNEAILNIIEPCNLFIDCGGEPMGDAQPDCAGICNGTSLPGDLDHNGIQNLADIQSYSAAAAVPGSLTISPCNDLNIDNIITIADAFLLNSCYTQIQNGGPLNINQDFCEFPFSVLNPQDTCFLRLGEVNTGEKYVSIQLRNPYFNIAALQFTLEGVAPLNVVSLLSDEITSLSATSSATGIIMAFTLQAGQYINKHNAYIEAFRIYYSELNADEICIASIQNVINEDHEEVNKRIEGDCLYASVSAIGSMQSLFSSPSPNPFSNSFLFSYTGPNKANYKLRIINTLGEAVYYHRGVPDEVILVETAGWHTGIYYLDVNFESAQPINYKILKK